MRSVAVALVVLSLGVGVVTVPPAAAEPIDDYEPEDCIDNGGIGADPFVDVSASAFYAAAVAWAYANDVVNGTDGTHFSPNDTMTRGQFAAVLHRVVCTPAPTGAADFDDLRIGAFYLDAVDWLVGEDLTTGIAPGLFGPERTLTRAEFVTFLFRLVGEPAGSPAAEFGDVPDGEFYTDAVDWALHRGLTTGTSSTTFSPDRALTRAEAVTFLYRLHTIGDVQASWSVLADGFGTPVALAQNPATGTWFVADKGGTLYAWRADSGTAVALTESVSQGSEQGLLGVAFTGDGSLMYVSYTDTAGDSVLVEYEMAGDTAGDRRVILEVDQPASNHNGGDVKVGPDGYVYWGLGDGGGSYDFYGNGQNTSSLLGTIIRIDPSTGSPYAIPDDNPFVDEPGWDQIWVYGLRNPWRFSFDTETDDLWIADVGQATREEITRIPGNEVVFGANNGGWPLREGSIATPHAKGGAAPADHAGPVHDYDLAGGQSITGGFVYRGDDIPALWGSYLWADYFVSDLMAWRDPYGVESAVVNAIGSRPTSFGQDADGEVYVVTTDGRLRKLVPA